MAIYNKAALVSTISEKTGLQKNQVDKVLSEFQDTIIDVVSKGEEVKLSGFAAFSSVTHESRMAKNPQTGEDVVVPKMKSVKIRPMKRFRESVRNS